MIIVSIHLSSKRLMEFDFSNAKIITLHLFELKKGKMPLRHQINPKFDQNKPMSKILWWMQKNSLKNDNMHDYYVK